MANDNNNKKELVDIDDDPTEELEALKLVQKDVPGNDNVSNSDTARKLKVLTELGSGANDNSDDIPLLGVKDALSMPAPGGDRSQIERELEQHDRALFERDRLIAELEDRIREYDETITQLEDQAGIRNGSNEDLADRARELDETFAELEDQLVMRDETIAELERKADIARVLEAQTANDTQTAENELKDKLVAAKRRIEEQTGRIAANEAEVRRLRGQLERTESYADGLRNDLADLTGNHRTSTRERGTLTSELDALRLELAEANAALETAEAERQAGGGRPGVEAQEHGGGEEEGHEPPEPTTARCVRHALGRPLSSRWKPPPF